MKKFYKQLIAITVSLILSFSASACTQNDEDVNLYTTSPTDTIDNEMPSESINKKIISKTICTESNTDVVKLRIPQFLSDIKQDFTHTNLLIYKQIVSYISKFDVSDLYLSDENLDLELNDEEYERLSLIGDYTIRLNNDKMISIVFRGLWNIKTEPHPNYYSFSVNIEKETEQLIDIQSMYDFNKEFSEFLLSNNEKWLLRSDQKEVIKEYFDLQSLNELFIDKNASFYLTENKLGVIISGLPNSIGNYCVFEIPYDEIVQFKSKTVDG